MQPVEPDLAGAFGQEVFLREPISSREPQRAFAGQQDVIGLLHDEACQTRDVPHVADGCDGASAVRRAVHDGGVEFDDAFLIRKAAVADGQLVRVVFDGGEPARAVAILDVDGGRTVARSGDLELATSMTEVDWVGRTVRIVDAGSFVAS